MMKVLDPYKDIPYSRLKGEKNEIFFKGMRILLSTQVGFPKLAII